METDIIFQIDSFTDLSCIEEDLASLKLEHSEPEVVFADQAEGSGKKKEDEFGVIPDNSSCYRSGT
ncbi:hypothetical protein D8674_022902 [Pyrus ussuriensis x Pyrus communis]|uniref:Uncharacterized protein n=1 Tax=Pyrus ussuriensis x Pyrus communis TaxID=2448454 RepID=A0A5N5GZV5_9ROSA|nr:hypothetical protein D8674_022902 [Pyrus ussuriensis x Pyrus communis]